MIKRKREERGSLTGRVGSTEGQRKISEEEVEYGDPQSYRKEDHWGNWQVVPNCNFGPGAELPACGNDMCFMLCASQKMCREVRKQGLNVAQQVTQQVSMWKSQGVGVDPQVPQTPGRGVAGGPVHPLSFLWPFWEQQGGKRSLWSCVSGSTLLVIYEWCRRNTLLKWQFLVYCIIILVINLVFIQWFPCPSHPTVLETEKSQSVLLLVDNSVIFVTTLERPQSTSDLAT